jgi:hypothetical protein
VRRGSSGNLEVRSKLVSHLREINQGYDYDARLILFGEGVQSPLLEILETLFDL